MAAGSASDCEQTAANPVEAFWCHVTVRWTVRFDSTIARIGECCNAANLLVRMKSGQPNCWCSAALSEWDDGEAPSSKPQAPKKLQVSNPKALLAQRYLPPPNPCSARGVGRFGSLEL